MGAKRGIKTYRKRAVVAMLDEYKQLHNLDVFDPQYTTIMSRQKNIEHSELLILLKKRGAEKLKEKVHR